MKKYLLALTIFSFSFFANAGNGGRTIGNGGDVLKCTKANSSIETYEILDWYEGYALKSLTLNLGGESLSTNEKLSIALERLKRVSPYRADRYAKHLESFFSETKWLTNGVLSDISDSDHIAIPEGCKILQIANQSTPILNSDKRYLIDKDLWGKLNNDQQATLLLHEVILREALEIGHLNSVSSRFLNSLILSEDIEAISIPEFTIILKKLGFQETSVQGVRINLDEFEFHNNGKLHFAKVIEGAQFSFGRNIIPLKDKIVFNSNGKLLELTPTLSMNIQYLNQTFSALPFPIKFYDNGNVESIMLGSPTLLKFNGHEIKINGSVKFFESGLLKVAVVESGNVLVKSITNHPLPVNNVIKFHESGTLLQANLLSPYKFFNLSCIGLVQFDQSERPTLVYLDSPGEVNIQGKLVALSSFTGVEFWPAPLSIKSATAAKLTYLLNKSQQRIKINEKTSFKLDEAGFLIN